MIVKDITTEPVIVHMAHRTAWFLNLRCGSLAILAFLTIHSPATRADEVDDLITARMRERQIVGVSVAVVDDGKIVKAKGYGFTDKSGSKPVTAATLFQAGSISKPVAAMGAMRLVQDGRLLLDEDVNAKLRTWNMPENEFTKDKKVTLRGILSHTAGLTVHGFPGYATGEPVPTVSQVLDGAKPANTAAVRVDFVPGSKWRYSGGGYTVMQQMIVDVTDKPFPEFMKATILTPLGMMTSTFEQPLPDDWADSAATGHWQNGEAVKGRWHVYPEMAAAGLWTTPTDLARFVMAMQKSLARREDLVLTQATSRLMLTEQRDGDALGAFVDGKDATLRFFHGGRDAGFDAQMVAYAHVGKGVVIMMNVNEDAGTMKDFVKVVAKQYGWSAGAEPQAK